MKNILPKLYIGPMSKNTVDAIIELYYDGVTLGFISSRRQIEYDGGYVNKWTTESFVEYVKESAPNTLVCRDHGGPGQGIENDDGVESFSYDANLMDIIHIDPWKKFTDIDKAVLKTAECIRFCNDINTHCLYEVGTEQSIREMSVGDLYNFLESLKNELGELFSKILYAVIQSGTSLKEDKNTGEYDEVKLKRMIEICREFSVLSKEHNGDYLDSNIIKEKFNIGLDAINIAPEFGIIETLCILDRVAVDTKLFDKIYRLCYNSGKWKKWVDREFDPFLEKRQMIKICCHYMFSNEQFKKILSSDLFKGINIEIKFKMKNRIMEIIN